MMYGSILPYIPPRHGHMQSLPAIRGRWGTAGLIITVLYPRTLVRVLYVLPHIRKYGKVRGVRGYELLYLVSSVHKYPRTSTGERNGSRLTEAAHWLVKYHMRAGQTAT